MSDPRMHLLLEPSRDETNQSETTIRQLAISSILNDFLIVDDLSIDMRAYLLESTLSPVVLSLERLLREITRRGVGLEELKGYANHVELGLMKEIDVSEDTKEISDLDVGINDLDAKANKGGDDLEVVIKETAYLEVGGAKEIDDMKVETKQELKATQETQDMFEQLMPKVKFDCLNWMAQDLFRNNPAQEPAAHSSQAMYASGMKDIAMALRGRIEGTRMAKEAEMIRLEQERVARELEIKKEREIAEVMRIARLQSVKEVFEEQLASILEVWMGCYLRHESGVLYRSEIVQAYEELIKHHDIQSNGHIHKVLLQALEIINTEKSTLPEATLQNEIFDKDDPIYLLDFSTIPKWDTEVFIKASLRLFCNWDINQLNFFLRHLSTHLETVKPQIEALFFQHLYIPKFPEQIHFVDQWRDELNPIFQLWDLSSDANSDQIEKAYRDYIRGKHNSRFERTVQIDPSLLHQDEVVQMAECSFAGFSLAILGEFGSKSYISMMHHIHAEVNKEVADRATIKQGVHENTIVLVKTQEEKEKDTCIDLLTQFLKLKRVEGVDTHDYIASDDALHLLFIIESKSETFSPGSEERDFLFQLRSRLSSPGHLLVSQLIERIDNTLGSKYQVGANVIQKLIETHHELADAALAQINNLPKELLERLKKEDQIVKEIALAIQSIEKKIPADGQTQFMLMGDVVFHIIRNAFQLWHPGHNVAWALNITETGVLKIAGADKISEDQSIEGNTIVELVLRTIACSHEFQDKLLGNLTCNGEGIDFQVLRSGTPLRVNNRNDAILSDNTFVKMSTASDQSPFFNILAIPLDTEHSPYEGTIDLITTGDKELLDVDDIRFMEKVAREVLESIKRIDVRNVRNELINSAKLMLRLKSEFVIDTFIAEDGAFVADKVYSWDSAKIDTNVSASKWPGSRYMTSIQANLQQLSPEESIVFSNGNNAYHPTDGKIAFIGVMDPLTKKCIAVFSINGLDSNPEASAEQIHEFEELFSLLGSAIETFSSPQSQRLENNLLAGECIDENTQRKMLFGKIMLQKCRKDIATLTVKSLAELRSYRVPPKSVHNILKGPLYLFGSLPIDLKDWRDTLSYINMDFLKAMIAYDPTAVQKKISIRRAKKILKGIDALIIAIPFKLAKQEKKGPAFIIREWLAISLALRDAAVASRKARADLFVRPITAESATENAPEDEDADGDQAVVEEFMEGEDAKNEAQKDGESKLEEI